MPPENPEHADRSGPGPGPGIGSSRGVGPPVAPLVFLHLPKTAGMTLRGILETVYRGQPMEFLGNMGGEVAQFASRPTVERARIALLAGHMPWGAQAMVPNARTITFLRDPVERVISVYFYNKRAPNALHHQAINDKDITLPQAIESGMLKGEYNLQTNMLRDHRATTSAQALASAKRNIRACAAFGLVERFDESLDYLSRELRWPTVEWQSRNTTKDRPRADELEPRVLDHLRKETAIDAELYQDAARLLSSRIAN